MKVLNIIVLILVIIGAINWGLYGTIGIDLVALIFGAKTAIAARIVYAIIGIAGIIALTFFYKLDQPNPATKK